MHPFERLWAALKAEFKAAYPTYEVTMREPTVSEAERVKAIWIAAPNIEVDQGARTNAPEVPLVIPIAINIIYSPSFRLPEETDDAPSEQHYLNVTLNRIKEQRVLERVAVKAADWGWRCQSQGSTITLTEKQSISALVFTAEFYEPAFKQEE